MMNITKEFAPPLKLVLPYFIIASIAYLIAMSTLFFLNTTSLHYLNMDIITWVHLFLIGFVILVIIGSMAQLIPVVLEVGHFAVHWFYIIIALLTFGLCCMLFAFLFALPLLPYAGGIFLMGIVLYLINLFATLFKVKRFTIVIKSIIFSHLFLLLGVILGVIMALNFAGFIAIDLNSFLKAHVYTLLVGYISLTIMGISLILLPMFGLSHGFNDQSIILSVYLLAFSIVFVLFALFFEFKLFEYFGYFLSLVAYGLYCYQIVLIYKFRARKENDIWVKSIYISFGSLVLCLFYFILYMLSYYTPYLLICAVLFIVGFLGFLITAHFYKIIPFLVWFNRFSPLVGKQKVPMLADMIPTKAAHYQLYFTLIGLVFFIVALTFHAPLLFNIAASFLFMGAVFLLHSVFYIINFRS
jgi:hypothetical protein